MNTDTKAVDPYEVLGVARTASDAEIKKAYRALARKLHPDLNPGDRELEERFKAVSAAYDFLKNSELRRRYDAGEIDATGAERSERTFYRHYADTGERHRYEPEGGSEDFSDFFVVILGTFFKNAPRRRFIARDILRPLFLKLIHFGFDMTHGNKRCSIA